MTVASDFPQAKGRGEEHPPLVLRALGTLDIFRVRTSENPYRAAGLWPTLLPGGEVQEERWGEGGRRRVSEAAPPAAASLRKASSLWNRAPGLLVCWSRPQEAGLEWVWSPQKSVPGGAALIPALEGSCWGGGWHFPSHLMPLHSRDP